MRFIFALAFAISAFIIWFFLALPSRHVYAHAPDRPDLNSWFDSLSSEGGGLCCSMNDGTTVLDVDWETKDGHYRVRLDGEWVDIPDNLVVKQPNRYGPAIVWRYPFYGQTKIRCFMPGAGT